ncbi:DUF2270 domain-containing protein [Halorarius litoreus]|uniref:DUF2270 domain-containing protein n=1 Tax=Halorarius litoreus TaxID=2962676 RepID=UPI0020CFC580|nr:DUF2270 domain-containing protein [Halorarius litoreus]
MTDPDQRIGSELFEGDPGSPLAHLYRGEIHRMKLWRERLDRTTNWAVTVLAAVMTWAFTSESNPHYVILVGGVMLGVFLWIEARRYRGYDMWRSRVRTLQENVFADALHPESGIEHDQWRQRLAADYRSPDMKITYEEAVAHRLRRVYLPLLGVLFAAWAFRVTAFHGATWPQSAAIGVVPGTVVTGIVAFVAAAALFIACRPRRWRAKGELHTDEVRHWDED